jgi:hypothetical protein
LYYYYQNWHDINEIAQQNGISNGSSSLSPRALHDGSGAIKPVKKKNKEQEPAFFFACLGYQRQQPFFLIGEIKKFENRKSSDFGVLQSPKVRMPEYDLLIKLFARFLYLVFRV